MTQTVKCLSAMLETGVRSLGQEDPLEKEMATHFSTLAWKIPWMEECGRVQSMGSQRVGHNWEWLHFFTIWVIRKAPGSESKRGHSSFFPLVLGSTCSSLWDTAAYKAHWFTMPRTSRRMVPYPCKRSSLSWCLSCAFSRPVLLAQVGSFRLMWYLT